MAVMVMVESVSMVVLVIAESGSKASKLFIFSFSLYLPLLYLPVSLLFLFVFHLLCSLAFLYLSTYSSPRFPNSLYHPSLPLPLFPRCIPSLPSLFLFLPSPTPSLPLCPLSLKWHWSTLAPKLRVAVPVRVKRHPRAP